MGLGSGSSLFGPEADRGREAHLPFSALRGTIPVKGSDDAGYTRNNPITFSILQIVLEKLSGAVALALSIMLLSSR